jgi:hypothetical protein
MKYSRVNLHDIESIQFERQGSGLESVEWLHFAMNTSYGKSEAAAADPFYKVRDNVNAQVERIKVKHDKLQDLLQQGDVGSGSVDFKELRKTLLKELKAAEKDVRGLQVAIEMIEKNRDKFPHIRDSELENRRSFVAELHNVVQDIKARADSESVRRKIESDVTHSKRDAYDESLSHMSKSVNPAERANARFIKEQRLETVSMIGHQDDAIDALGMAVDRLGNLGKEVNVELKEQNIMLAGLDDELDEAGNRMNLVMGSLAKLLKTKDGCMIWTVVILFLILVLLIALVIWT